MKRIVVWFAAVLGVAALLSSAACNRWEPDESRSENKLRVVSVSPSVTEMLFALGAEDLVVGVSDFCDFPVEAKEIESVGGFGTPNLEKLIALSPDVVIATGLKRSDMTEVLRRSGIRILWLKTGTFSEVFETLREIGREVGRLPRAEEVVSEMQRELDAIAERHGDAPASDRPRVFVEVWGDPMTTAGGLSFVDELIDRAGGINVAHELDHAYPTINPEKVLDWDPEVIVLGYMTHQEVTKESLAGRIGWSNISAVRSGRIVTDIPSDFLLRPGPRLVEGARLLSQEFHGVSSGGQESE